MLQKELVEGMEDVNDEDADEKGAYEILGDTKKGRGRGYVLSHDHSRSNRSSLFSFLNLGTQILTCAWSLCQAFIVVIDIVRQIHVKIIRNIDFNLGIS